MCESGESLRMESMETTERALKLDGVVETRDSLSFQETIRDVIEGMLLTLILLTLLFI
jgi:hypothetical protein